MKQGHGRSDECSDEAYSISGLRECVCAVNAVLAAQYVNPSYTDGIHHKGISKSKFKDGKKSLPHQHPL